MGRSGALVRASRPPEHQHRRDRQQLAGFAFDDLPSALVDQPVVALAEGLLPNSNRVATILTTSVLAHVTAGGSALDGVQSGRAEALPELLVGRGGF